MENENSNEEQLIKDNESSVKTDVNKDKRMSVLKQLDNKKLYPVQERVGIFIIAALSTIGLVLIAYTGVMAITSNPLHMVEAPTVEVDVEDVYDLLEEIDAATDPSEDGELEDGDVESNHEPLEDEDDSEPDDDEDATDSSAPSTATVNADLIGIRRNLTTSDIIEFLNEGDVVEIIDLETNIYWVEVAYDSSEFGRLEGFISREFLDY